MGKACCRGPWGPTRFSDDSAHLMIPIGYLYKRVSKRPGWITSEVVEDLYSISNHASPDFMDYMDLWRHNGYWLFDSPTVMQELALNAGIPLVGCTLFYYETYEYQFDGLAWTTFQPEPSFLVDIKAPERHQVHGYDIATFNLGNAPECSPLACNDLARGIVVNQHCLLNSFEDAKQSLESGQFENSEEGPFRIIAVHTVS